MDRSSAPELPPRSRIALGRAEREYAMPVRDETEAVLDRWMRGILHERYTPTLREPLPEALLRLLDAADQAGRACGEVAGVLKRAH